MAPYAYNQFVGDTGRFQYAVGIPSNRSSGTVSGSGTVYYLDGTGNDVVLSHVGNYYQTYPVDPSSPWYFRKGQAVGVKAGATGQSDVSASWQIDKTNDILSFYIDGISDAGLLGDTFTLQWAMTCANDVLLASTNLTAGGGGPPPAPTPLPAALPLFAGGLGLLGALYLRRRNRTVLG